jgi:hypothetical protein
MLQLDDLLVTGSFILLPRDTVMLASDAARNIINDLRRLSASKNKMAAIEWRPRALRQILRLMLHLSRASNLRESLPQGMLAALNLGNAIVDIHILLEQPDLDSQLSGALEDALILLADFATDPQRTADKLIALADQADNGSVVIALTDAAYALQQGAALIEMVCIGKEMKNV